MNDQTPKKTPSRHGGRPIPEGPARGGWAPDYSHWQKGTDALPEGADGMVSDRGADLPEGADGILSDGAEGDPAPPIPWDQMDEATLYRALQAEFTVPMVHHQDLGETGNVLLRCPRCGHVSGAIPQAKAEGTICNVCHREGAETAWRLSQPAAPAPGWAEVLPPEVLPAFEETAGHLFEGAEPAEAERRRAVAALCFAGAMDLCTLEAAHNLTGRSWGEIFEGWALPGLAAFNAEIETAFRVMAHLKAESRKALIAHMQTRGLNPSGATTEFLASDSLQVIVTKATEKVEAPDFQDRATALWTLVTEANNPTLTAAAEKALKRTYKGYKVPLRTLAKQGGAIGALAASMYLDGPPTYEVKVVRLALGDGN